MASLVRHGSTCLDPGQYGKGAQDFWLVGERSRRLILGAGSYYSACLRVVGEITEDGAQAEKTKTQKTLYGFRDRVSVICR